ncbi:MAG: hypothetical protein AMJ93_14090 [Anaerolineae bacterium SM23_84]|nr:MAG: hypothetical protein AMJ93_14090 [Anaerolineae bacterium SM23_84]
MTETREEYVTGIGNIHPTQELVVHDEALMPSTVEGVKAQAEELVKSGLLPDHVKTPQQAFAIITMGRELGIPPMQSLRSIYVVGGQPHLNAQMMGALIYKAGHGYQTDVLTEEECTITFKRRDGAVYVHTVTMQEAQRLRWDKDWDKATNQYKDKWAWKRYPKALLFARCLSAGARVHMPDAIHNMYAIVTDERGMVIDAEIEPVPEHMEILTPTQPVPPELVEHDHGAEKAVEMPVPETEFSAADYKPVKASALDPEGRPWWQALLTELKPHYDSHYHVANTLAKIRYDPAALDYEHRDEIKRLLLERKLDKMLEA